MTALTERRLYTVKEVADQLRVHEETIRRWLRDGKITGIRMGGSRSGYRISEDEVERVRRQGVDG
jgi:excisionase family DNA binding protein